MEIPKVLPELGNMVPHLLAILIDYNGEQWAKLRMADIPAHETVRIGFKLYTVHEYDASMDAWQVRPLTATVTKADEDWLWRQRGD
jgi:hypothetical protein